MARMTDVDVDYISLVKKGANKQKIQIYKADEEPDNLSNEDIEEVTGFFNALKSFFTKEEVKTTESVTKIKGFNERMTTREVMDNIWRVNETLVSVMRDVLGSSDIKDKEAALNTAIDEHGAYLKTRIKGIDIKKSEELFKKEGGNENMKKEDLQEIIKEAIAPINEKIEAIEKELSPGEVEEKEVEEKEAITKEDIAKAVTEAISPLNERIERIENHKGVSKQLEGGESVKKESTSIFAGINI